ncbi:MAG: low temperature requirement protein A [Acidobacteria bacterium]|nr:low temperature requirement protein A [Acidobacteriota bacterium]MDA1234387.1 low temperature requirement protein A [Acidobacteriota bacterium]
MPASQPLASAEDQSAAFVELFFDLVFVYSVTQVVGLLHHHLDWVGAGQAVLVFWLVWWAWTQFTWTLNAANTAHTHIQFWTLAATAVAFFMAVALPDAFNGGGLGFAIPYVAVRVIGLLLYVWVAWEKPSQRTAVKRFGLLSVGGLAAAIAGGVAGGSEQYWLWGLAIVLDFLAAWVGGQAEGWDLDPEHFAERHGLFVIIALGESLIVTASGLAGVAWTVSSSIVAILAVSLSCALWWSYFARGRPRLEQALTAHTGLKQSLMARDAFSLMHFPMLGGVIAYAVAIEQVATHAGEPLALNARVALALGLLLFVGGMAAAMWRATCGRLWPRVLIVSATAALVVALGGVPAMVSLGVALTGVVAIAAVEQRATTALVE